MSVALAVIVSELGVLVVRRRDRSPPIAFPGGRIEDGETAARCAEREVGEETGLNVRAERVLGERVHPVTDVRLVYLACTPLRARDPLRLAAREVDAVMWWTAGEVLTAMPDLFAPVRVWLVAATG